MHNRAVKTAALLATIKEEQDQVKKNKLAWEVVALNEGATWWLVSKITTMSHFCVPLEDRLIEARLALFDAALYYEQDKGKTYLSVAMWFFCARSAKYRVTDCVKLPVFPSIKELEVPLKSFIKKNDAPDFFTGLIDALHFLSSSKSFHKKAYRLNKKNVEALINSKNILDYLPQKGRPSEDWVFSYESLYNDYGHILSERTGLDVTGNFSSDDPNAPITDINFNKKSRISTSINPESKNLHEEALSIEIKPIMSRYDSEFNFLSVDDPIKECELDLFKMKEYMKRLSPLETDSLLTYAGSTTIKEVSLKHNCSRQWVEQVRKAAMRKMRCGLQVPDLLKLNETDFDAVSVNNQKIDSDLNAPTGGQGADQGESADDGEWSI